MSHHLKYFLMVRGIYYVFPWFRGYTCYKAQPLFVGLTAWWRKNLFFPKLRYFPCRKSENPRIGSSNTNHKPIPKYRVYKSIHAWNLWMSSILGLQPSKTMSFRIKTRVIWVQGEYKPCQFVYRPLRQIPHRTEVDSRSINCLKKDGWGISSFWAVNKPYCFG